MSVARLARTSQVVRLDELDAHLWENMFFRKWSTVSALSLLIWDFLIVFPNEVRHIWSRPFNAVKIVYILSRYFALLVQAVNVYLVFGPLSKFPLPESHCKLWFGFLVASASLLMAALDFILMLRVFALHQKDTKIGTFLLLLFLGQVVLVANLAPKSVLKIPYDDFCDTVKTHPSAVYYSISVWVTHISLAILTLMKKDLVALGVPVVRLVARDGICALVAVCALFAAIVPYSIIRQASKAHVVLGWPISFLSLGCCRLIMNLQTLRLNNGEAVSSRTELESYIINETRATRENANLTVDIASEIQS